MQVPTSLYIEVALFLEQWSNQETIVGFTLDIGPCEVFELMPIEEGAVETDLYLFQETIV